MLALLKIGILDGGCVDWVDVYLVAAELEVLAHL